MNTKKENCDDCKDLPEGEAIRGHDHRQPLFKIGDTVHFNHQSPSEPRRIMGVTHRGFDYMVELDDKNIAGLFNESLFTKIL